MAEFETLVDLYQQSCTRYADRELFGTRSEGGWRWITYAEFAQQVDKARAGLAARGVGPGDRVAIISDNRVEWAVAAYATYGRGAQFVPMYEAQKASDWRFILEDCGAKVVLGSRPEIVEQLRTLRDELPLLEHVLGFDLPDDDPDAFVALLAAGEAEPVEAIHPDSGDLAGFIYTSGTTGAPKGVKLSHDNLCSNINAIHACFTFEPTDRSLSFLPWAHSFGQTCELHGLLSMGSSVAINDEIPNLVGNLGEVKPTILFAVPRIFNRIYDGVNKQMSERPSIIQGLFKAGISAAAKRSEGLELGLFEKWQLSLADRLIFTKVRERFGGRLRYAISGSAALSQEVARFIDALGIEVYEGYGLTETSPIATANFPGHRKIGSVGRAIPEVRIEIDREATGDDKHGEILIYGPNVMQGYHNREEANREVLMEDGGFRSGDMGYLDEDGYLYITGRIKEQYKLENGKYVVPSPLEEQLKLSPFIANVMIHGANHPHNVALVVPDPVSVQDWAADQGIELPEDPASHPALIERIEAEIKEHSASFKGYERPKEIVLVMEDFTTENGMLTPTMKLKRRAVLARYGELLEGLYR